MRPGRILVLLLFAFIASNIAVQAQGVAVENKLIISWIEYDFGDVLLGSVVKTELMLQNKSQDVLSFFVINACSCIHTTIQSASIQPSASKALIVSFDTKDKSPGKKVQNFGIYIPELEKQIVLLLKANIVVDS